MSARVGRAREVLGHLEKGAEQKKRLKSGKSGRKVPKKRAKSDEMRRRALQSDGEKAQDKSAVL